MDNIYVGVCAFSGCLRLSKGQRLTLGLTDVSVRGQAGGQQALHIHTHIHGQVEVQK